jgi:tetratricopeptide (TPR) repeat protein
LAVVSYHHQISYQPHRAGRGDHRMKAEHRKQLETNTLADNLGKLLQGLHHGLSRNFWVVLGIILGIVVLFYTWKAFSDYSQRYNASLWYKWDQFDDPEEVDNAISELPKEELYKIQNNIDQIGRLREDLELQRLEAFAKKNAGYTQGRMARFQMARLTLFEGLRDLGRQETRPRALKSLEMAVETYDKLSKDARDIPLLHQEALLNSGKANESLGHIEKAMEKYQQLQTSYPETEMGKLGERERQRLKKDAKTTEKLAEDLTKVTPPPAQFPPKD